MEEIQTNNPAIEAFEPFQRRSLKEEIYESLYNRIIAGKYQPGKWLRQVEISSHLGVSQTPVREALDLLVSVGLAERVPYRGVRVLKLSHEEIVDAYTLRLLLESTAARVAAIQRTQDQAGRLLQILGEMKPLVNLNEMSKQRQLNREFHLLVIKATGTPLLVKICEVVFNRFPDWMLYEYMFRHPELLPSSLEGEYKEHLKIAEAISVGDAEGAYEGVVEHILKRRNELVTFLGVPEKLLTEKTRQYEIRG